MHNAQMECPLIRDPEDTQSALLKQIYHQTSKHQMTDQALKEGEDNLSSFNKYRCSLKAGLLKTCSSRVLLILIHYIFIH